MSFHKDVKLLCLRFSSCNFNFQPRANEAGGMFGKGIIVRKYEMNQVIKVRVELTANHMGWFEFRLCPNNAPHKVASQLCLDQHILKQSTGFGSK